MGGGGSIPDGGSNIPGGGGKRVGGGGNIPGGGGSPGGGGNIPGGGGKALCKDWDPFNGGGGGKNDELLWFVFENEVVEEERLLEVWLSFLLALEKGSVAIFFLMMLSKSANWFMKSI